jgi:hypothetical protein
MYLISTTADALQDQNFTYGDYDLTLTLRWNSVVGFWNFDLYDNTNDVQVTQSEALSIGSASLIGSNLPFIFLLNDDSGLGTNAVSISELSDRLNLYIVDKEVYNASLKQSNTINYR